MSRFRRRPTIKVKLAQKELEQELLELFGKYDSSKMADLDFCYFIKTLRAIYRDYARSGFGIDDLDGVMQAAMSKLGAKADDKLANMIENLPVHHKDLIV